jgi:hypothetical protein
MTRGPGSSTTCARPSSGGLGVARPSEQIVDKATHQSVQFLNISVAPVGECRSAQSHPSGVECICESLAVGRENGLLDASVFGTRMSLYQPQFGQLRHLSTDGRVVATCSISEVDNSYWFESLDADQERKQSAIQRDTRFLNQNLVALGKICERDEIDK